MEKQNHRPQCAKSLNHLSYRQPPPPSPPALYGHLYGHPPCFYLFLQTPCFWQDVFNNIAPMKCWLDTKINSRGKVKKVKVKINLLNERLAE